MLMKKVLKLLRDRIALPSSSVYLCFNLDRMYDDGTITREEYTQTKQWVTQQLDPFRTLEEYAASNKGAVALTKHNRQARLIWLDAVIGGVPHARYMAKVYLSPYCQTSQVPHDHTQR